MRRDATPCCARPGTGWRAASIPSTASMPARIGRCRPGERERARRAIGRHLGGRRCGHSRPDGCGREGTLDRLKGIGARSWIRKIAELLVTGRIVKDHRRWSVGRAWQCCRCRALRGRRSAQDGRTQFRRSGRPVYCISGICGMSSATSSSTMAIFSGMASAMAARLNRRSGGSGRLCAPARACTDQVREQARSDFPGHGRAAGQATLQGRCVLIFHPSDRCGTPCVAIAGPVSRRRRSAARATSRRLRSCLSKIW